MSHKTHPKILRVRRTEDWLSRGFYKKNFPQYLEEDFMIRSFLEKKLPKGTIESIEIERGTTVLKIIIKTSRPALVIGRGGEGVEGLKKEIEKIFKKKKKKERELKKDIRILPKSARQNLVSSLRSEIKIEIVAARNSWGSAALSSQWIASQIEKRVRYRRVLKMALSRIMSSKEIKGARVEVSGRLNGVNIARTEWLQEGEMPRQKLRAVIDYNLSLAYCTYGVIGVKVWIYKGEKFE